VLETFDAPLTCTYVKFTSDELTSLCPLTGQPDFNTLEIEYIPNKVCIESKSLKRYLQSYRDKQAFVEQLAAKIAGDVQRATEARHLRVTVTQHTRGGIVTEATAELPAPTAGKR
jgi:7-cyano-7-deazaguanine reductase